MPAPQIHNTPAEAMNSWGRNQDEIYSPGGKMDQVPQTGPKLLEGLRLEQKTEWVENCSNSGLSMPVKDIVKTLTEAHCLLIQPQPVLQLIFIQVQFLRNYATTSGKWVLISIEIWNHKESVLTVTGVLASAHVFSTLLRSADFCLDLPVAGDLALVHFSEREAKRPSCVHFHLSPALHTPTSTATIARSNFLSLPATSVLWFLQLPLI